MTGNNGHGMVLQERDLHLLRELSDFRVIDRELARAIAGFGSTTRVNARLLRLSQAGLLRRFVMGNVGVGQKFLYALSPKGAEYLGMPFRGPRRRAEEALVADIFIEHQLAINEIHRMVKYAPMPVEGAVFIRWVSFFKEVTPGSRLIPDGYFEIKAAQGTVAAFLEVDLGHEHLPIWKKKVESYIRLAASGEFCKLFGHDRFRVIVVATSDRRLEYLRRAVVAVTDRVFWFATLERVKRDGLFAPVWLRPTDAGRHPLIGTPQ